MIKINYLISDLRISNEESTRDIKHYDRDLVRLSDKICSYNKKDIIKIGSKFYKVDQKILITEIDNYDCV